MTKKIDPLTKEQAKLKSEKNKLYYQSKKVGVYDDLTKVRLGFMGLNLEKRVEIRTSTQLIEGCNRVIECAYNGDIPMKMASDYLDIVEKRFKIVREHEVIPVIKKFYAQMQEKATPLGIVLPHLPILDIKGGGSLLPSGEPEEKNIVKKKVKTKKKQT